MIYNHTSEQLYSTLFSSEFLASFSAQWLKPTLLPKGKILLEIGEVSNKLYLVKKGVIRAFYLTNEEDITSWLVANGSIACLTDSFLQQSPSEMGLETLENTWAFAISYDQYKYIQQHDITTAKLVISLYETFLIDPQKGMNLFKYSSVDERISRYLNDPKSLFRRIPDRYIATYLGTTESTFCKCLKRVNRSKT